MLAKKVKLRNEGLEGIQPDAKCVGTRRASVVVAVAVRLYRDGLAATLGAHPHLRVDGVAGTLPEALNAVNRHRPDVVIVDVALDDALGLMRTLRAGDSKSRILAIAVTEEINTILNYVEAGADGFVTANSTVEELVEAVERIVDGELLCSARMAAQLLKRATEQHVRLPLRGAIRSLTDRETQVLSLLKLGRSNKQIGLALNISEATVKNHVHHLLEKMQVSTRGQAIATTMHIQPVVPERPALSRPES